MAVEPPIRGEPEPEGEAVPGVNPGLAEEESSNGAGPERLDSDDPHGGASMSLAERILSGGTRGAQRVAGATGLDRAVEAAVEDAIVAAIESEATEKAIARILNGPVVEQAVQEALGSEAVEKALVDTVDSELVDRVWARLLDSDETQRLIERIAEAPEVRAAIASQGIGLIDDVGRQVARVTRILDFIGERVARRILFRAKRTTPTDRVGLFTRALALGIDALVINVVLLTTSALVGAIAAMFGASFGEAGGQFLALGAATWFLLGSLYLFTFWALSGQTPGMRFLDIRIERDGNPEIGARSAFRRLVGFWLSVIPLCLGFIGVLVRIDRRGFHDRLAKTMVFYVNPVEPDQPHEAAVLGPEEVPPVGAER